MRVGLPREHELKRRHGAAPRRAGRWYARNYAKKFVNGRTVVLILSDGYDTGPAHQLAGALAQLKKRGCKIIWLNPLKSWQDYQPIAKGMAAAMPYLDGFKSAGSLAELATLEPELARL